MLALQLKQSFLLTKFMRVLITGITGFLGGALARAYIKQGGDVVGLARPCSSRKWLSDRPIEWLEGDITDPSSLEGKFQGIDAVIHAAGRLGKFGITEAEYDAIHVDGTRNVLVEAERAEVSRVLHISTCGVLGPTAPTPMTEEAPFSPSNPYEWSKMEGERVASFFADQGVPVIIGRPDFIYGPYDEHVLGLFRAIAAGQYFHIDGGRATCVPTYIDDCVAGLMLALTNGEPGEVYQITGAEPVSFQHFVTTIAQALDVAPPRLSIPKPLATVGARTLELVTPLVGKSPPLTVNAVDFFTHHHQFSFAKAERELGYRPAVDLRSGIERTVAWYRQVGLLTSN